MTHVQDKLRNSNSFAHAIYPPSLSGSGTHEKRLAKYRISIKD